MSCLTSVLQPGLEHLPFIDKPSEVLHIDINSCFATVEQQCNSLLRGRPVVVAAYTGQNSCILSPSIEAKRLGIKTGMSVKEGQQHCMDLVVLRTDPVKYRWINQKMAAICGSYTPAMEVKSIDEMVLDLHRTPCLDQGLLAVGLELKQRIRQEIGEWMSASVGIGPNRWLAKQAAGLVKPDGLEELQWWNIESVLAGLSLEDLHGIGAKNAGRLRRAGLYQPLAVYQAPISQLRQAFGSIMGLYYAAKLHGYEVDDYEQQRRTLSHEYSLPQSARTMAELQTALSKLCHKLGSRLSRRSLQARGIFVGLMWGEWECWHSQIGCPEVVAGWQELHHYSWDLVCRAVAQPGQTIGWPIRKVTVGCFDLEEVNDKQLNLWQGDKGRQLRLAVRQIQADFGSQAIGPARAMQDYPVKRIPDFVAFSGKGVLE